MNIASQQGFTLIELIVVIVILAILSAVSLPSFQDTIIQNRMSTEINQLVTDLHFAKTEAIKRSRDIKLCAANSTFDDCGGDASEGNWGAYGWLVMDEKEIIRVTGAISGSDVLTEIGVPGDKGIVTFNRYGFTTGSARSFVLCGPFGNNGVIKGAVITSSGRIRNAADLDNNGVVEYVKIDANQTDEMSLTSVNMEC